MTTEDKKTVRALLFYHAGLPIMHTEEGVNSFLSEKTIEIMNGYPDVPFYQIQTSVLHDGHVLNKVKVFKNDAFDTEYIKVRGNQSNVMLDGIKTMMYGKKLSHMNEELKKGDYTSVKELLRTILPLYQTLYKGNDTGLFVVPSMIENDDRHYSFGISTIIKYHDGEIQYLNSLIMDEIGFVEGSDPGIPWFMAEGIMEQRSMPEELKELLSQAEEQQSEMPEYMQIIQ